MRHVIGSVILIALAASARGAVAAAPVDGAPAGGGRAVHAHDAHSVRLGLEIERAGRDDYDAFHGSGHAGVSEVFGVGWDMGIMLRGHYNWTNRSGDLPTGDINYLLVPKYRFHQDDAFSPYLGLQLGITTSWYSHNTGVVGGTGSVTYDRRIAHTATGGGVAGFDWFLDRKVSLFVEISSLYTVVDNDLVRYNDLVLGLSYWF